MSVSMNNFVIFGAIILALGFLTFFISWSFGADGSIVDKVAENEVSVVLTDAGYEPRHFKIKGGTKVIFSTTRAGQHWPASNLHPSHDIYSEFDPERPLESNEEWSFVFEKEGVWGFHDHVRSYYTGIIYVVE